MNKTLGALVVLATCTLGAGTPVLAGDIVGTVVNSSGDPVSGARILTSTGVDNVAGTAITDSQGHYAIRGLSSSQYNITLDPASSGLKGQTVVSYVGDKGVTVDWATAHNREPIATAQTGAHTSSVTQSSNTFSSNTFASSAQDKKNPPPGCKGMDGPPCGPKSGKD
jgi:hypothetical protein